MICNFFYVYILTTTTTDLVIIPGLKIFCNLPVSQCATAEWWWEHLIILCNVLLNLSNQPFLSPGSYKLFSIWFFASQGRPHLTRFEKVSSIP